MVAQYTERTVVMRLQGLTKSFGDHMVLDAIDLDLAAGEVTVLSGENGAGKSTLLECVAGAQPMDGGEVVLNGHAISAQRTDYWKAVYSILDDFAWFPDLTVFDHYRLMDPMLTRDAARERLATLRAEAFLDRKTMTLSAGQRQRCALVSAAVRQWTVLLIDEPERHLDRETVPELGRLLQDLASRGAILIASHDERLTSLANARRLHIQDNRVVAET